MSARKQARGRGREAVRSWPCRPSPPPDLCPLIAPAKAAGSCIETASLQAKPTGLCRPLAPDYSRDSRSRPLAVPRCESLRPSAIPEDAPSVRSTAPGTPPFFGCSCEGEPDRRIPVRLPPSRSCFESLSPPPNLFNSAEGLSMEKTACAFFYPVMKSVLIESKPRTPKQLRDYERKPLILRSYTLCEVPEESRQELPTPGPL